MSSEDSRQAARPHSSCGTRSVLRGLGRARRRILDRLLHHSTVVNIKGGSDRIRAHMPRPEALLCENPVVTDLVPGESRGDCDAHAGGPSAS
jgi:hypothetical protein